MADKTDKIRAYLGRPVFDSFLPENLIEHLMRAGAPLEFCRKTSTRKWARREANRLNRLITANPQLTREPFLQVSLPDGFTQQVSTQQVVE